MFRAYVVGRLIYHILKGLWNLVTYSFNAHVPWAPLDIDTDIDRGTGVEYMKPSKGQSTNSRGTAVRVCLKFFLCTMSSQPPACHKLHNNSCSFQRGLPSDMWTLIYNCIKDSDALQNFIPQPSAVESYWKRDGTIWYDIHLLSYLLQALKFSRPLTTK